ncbi:hypothetical protein BU15DRAFT_64977 [Melanogaster broomeanus]|nr:hypothetical protein BU15DRAFT_64977 [Melanogaster broomeanus]
MQEYAHPLGGQYSRASGFLSTTKQKRCSGYIPLPLRYKESWVCLCYQIMYWKMMWKAWRVAKNKIRQRMQRPAVESIRKRRRTVPPSDDGAPDDHRQTSPTLHPWNKKYFGMRLAKAVEVLILLTGHALELGKEDQISLMEPPKTEEAMPPWVFGKVQGFTKLFKETSKLNLDYLKTPNLHGSREYVHRDDSSYLAVWHEDHPPKIVFLTEEEDRSSTILAKSSQGYAQVPKCTGDGRGWRQGGGGGWGEGEGGEGGGEGGGRWRGGEGEGEGGGEGEGEGGGEGGGEGEGEGEQQCEGGDQDEQPDPQPQYGPSSMDVDGEFPVTGLGSAQGGGGEATPTPMQ